MHATTESISVEREITIAASPETVWELLVDSKQAIKWMGQTATFDLRPGGSYRVEVIPGHTARGEFVEIDPPRRLIYCLLYTSPSPRDRTRSRMPSSA